MRVPMDAVTALLREVAEAVVLPQRRELLHGDVEEKSPGEPVTVADREAEALLSTGLAGLLDVPVIGEEATAGDPSQLRALPNAPAVWLVDPIDGTSAFVEGTDHFAMMISLVSNGETVAAWIHQPVSGTTYVAERGCGAFRDQTRLVIDQTTRPVGALSGVALTRFLPPAQVAAVERAERALGTVGRGPATAGVLYPRVAEGGLDFVLFWRTLPWDHAPGALLVTEAGGSACHLDGRTYRPGRPQEGLLVARGPRVWSDVNAVLALVGAPITPGAAPPPAP